MTVDLFRPVRFIVRRAMEKGGESAYQCGRCGSLVLSTTQHTRWHASVDSAATTEVARRG